VAEALGKGGGLKRFIHKRSSGEGLRGFESHPPHHHVEIIGGFVQVISSIVLWLPEDLSTIIVFPGDEFKAPSDRSI